MQKLIVDYGQNKLGILYKGNYHVIKCRTVYQVEQYNKLMQEINNKNENTNNIVEILKTNDELYLSLAYIAMNYKPDVNISKEDIAKEYSLDEIELIAKTWLERFFMPKLEQDPKLVP